MTLSRALGTTGIAALALASARCAVPRDAESSSHVPTLDRSSGPRTLRDLPRRRPGGTGLHPQRPPRRF